MRVLTVLLAGFVPFGLCSFQLENSEEVIRQDISKLPKCCIGCVIPVLGKFHSATNNLTELVGEFCYDMVIQKNVSQCTGESCNYWDLLHSEQLLQVICKGAPSPTLRPQIYAITTITSIIVTVFVALRCHSNYQISKKVWWDDGFLFLSAVVFLAFQSLTIWGAHYGFGLHIWTANTSHWYGLHFFEWLWEILYIIVQTMTKISVLLLYYRIFPQIWFRRILFTLIGFMFLHFVVFTAVIVTACKPISSFWDQSLEGQCIDTRPVGLIGAGCSIVEDIVFLCLPIPLIWKLKLKTSRKIGITLILTIGVVACAASIVRLRYLAKYNQTFDQVWENYLIVILSQIELSLSIICVCFPAIRLLFCRSRKREDDSCNSKATSAPSQSFGSSHQHSTGFVTKILSIMSNHTPRGSFSMPWVTSQAPQLSSIYITSHIELSDKEPTGTDARIREYETQIATSNNLEEKKMHQTKSPFFVPPGIMHVDKSGNFTTPLRKLTDSISLSDQSNQKYGIESYPVAGNQEVDIIGAAK